MKRPVYIYIYIYIYMLALAARVLYVIQINFVIL